MKKKTNRIISISSPLEITANNKTLKKLQLSQIIPKKPLKNNEKVIYKRKKNHSQVLDRFEEFNRMRSPKKKSLFEEYNEKNQNYSKPVFLNTYYKIPHGLNDLKKSKYKRKN